MTSFKQAALNTLATILLTLMVAGPSTSQQPSGIISGRVTIAGKPAPDVTVLMTRVPDPKAFSIASMLSGSKAEKTVTDANGDYQFREVAAGRYQIAPYAPMLVASGGDGKETVNITDGQEPARIDFSLVRGGVITGRVIGGQGKSVVGEVVKVLRTDKPGDQRTQLEMFDVTGLIDTRFSTDDRGIYRIYGLAPGRYVVSVGQPADGSGAFNLKKRFIKETYHPGYTDKSRATVVDVTAGGEVTGVDIRLDLPSDTFKVSGRIVDAETGRPVAKAVANYNAADNQLSGPSFFMTSLTNAKGEFQFDSVMPGRYSAFAAFDGNSDYYSERSPFEVRAANVSGVEIRVRRGASVSGIVSVEGSDNPEILASASQLRLLGIVTPSAQTASKVISTTVAPDGSFHFRGVPEGTIQFAVNRFYTPTRLEVMRVERNGMAEANGIQVEKGQSVSDVHLVLGYAGGIIRGSVNLVNGVLPEKARLGVFAKRSGGPARSEWTEVDPSGRFIFEHLLPGDYELTLSWNASGDKPPAQVITVTNESEAIVTMTLDLSVKRDR